MKRETRQTLAYFNNHCEAIQERKKIPKGNVHKKRESRYRKNFGN